MKNVTYKDLRNGFENAGICKGDTVLIHSAMTPIGNVEGGAKSVAKALIDAVGEEGTVVAPAFCFAKEAEEEPIIDVQNDKSEMGAVSEAIRTTPGAKRSIAYRHSFSAIGKHADKIINVNPYYSVFDIDSSFGKLLGLNAKVILLGVTWVNSTTHHFAEYLLNVKDRHTVEKRVKIKNEDGSLTAAVLTDYQPKPNDSGEYYSFPHDFNRAGLMLEKSGKVRISPVGNALARVHYMRDLVHLFLDNYGVTYNMFAVDDISGKPVILPDGVTLKKKYHDGCGRLDIAEWSCVNKDDIFKKLNTIG